MTEHRVLGAGISLRREHVADAFLSTDALDLVEIVADHYFHAHSQTHGQLGVLAQRFTVVPHALDLSLGSAEGIDAAYLKRLKAIVATSRAPYWSEHIAFTRSGGRRTGHLAPVPFTNEALEVFVANVARVRAAIDVPVILENIACAFDVPGADFSEPEFVTLLVRQTGCGLLLDVANLYYNARNRGQDPYAVLHAFPLEAVVQCHLAGGHRSGSEWIDSHAFAVPDEVWGLFEEVARRAPLRAAIVERDENLPAFAELAAEAARARDIMRRYAR